MKKEKGKKEEEKPVTVVEKWNRDIKGMRATAKGMKQTAKSMRETAKNFRKQSMKRANMRMEAFRNSFTNDIKGIETTVGDLRKEVKAFAGQCHRDVRLMRAAVVKMQNKLNLHRAKVNDYRAKFKSDAKGMRDIVKGMAIHIWGTTA